MSDISYGPSLMAEIMNEIISNEETGVAMYAVVEEADNGFEFKQIDVEDKSQTREYDMKLVRDAFSPYCGEDARYDTLTNALDLKNCIAVIDNQSLTAMRETVEKIRDDCTNIQKLPLEHFIEGAYQVKGMFDRGELDFLTNDDYRNMRGLLFRYDLANGECVFCFQRTIPSSIVEQSDLLIKKHVSRRYKLFTEESIRITHSFDFIIIDDVVLSIKPSTVVKYFGLESVRQTQAIDSIAMIEQYVSDASILKNRIMKNRVQTINKVIRIAESPVLKINPKELRKRIEGSEEYSKIRYSFDGNDRIEINDDESALNALKILDDAIGKSPITGVVYESQVKQRIDSGE